MRYKHGKTALVLAGGGLTGAVYEIGALRAIDDLLVDRTVNDFDIYVGTSAGALVSALLANGISPETMLQAIEGSNPNIPSIQRQHIFGMHFPDLLQWGSRIPRKMLGAWLYYLFHMNDMTFFDLLWTLTEVFPSGLYDGLALEKFVREALSTLNRSNNFQTLARDLYIIATHLESGERAVFGKGTHEDVPISLAVAASSAVPMIYKPVRIEEKEYVDGSLRGNASLDVAIEHGATLILCINPMVPIKNASERPAIRSSWKENYLTDKGIQAIANQTLRITTHAGLHYHIKQLRRAYPEVDIILIEPKLEDQQIYLTNIMRYSARLAVARYGFEAATVGLAEDYAHYKGVLARHGIPLTRRLVITELNEIRQSNYDPEVIRHVLEARVPRCRKQKPDDPICQLTRSLAELELAIDNMSAQ